MRFHTPLFAAVLLLTPTLWPITTAQGEPMVDALEPDADRSDTPSPRSSHPARMEGWGFDRASGNEPVGRFSLNAQWTPGERLTGTLRISRDTSYSFEARRDLDMWTDQTLGVVVERYAGTATPTNSEAAYTILLDYIPEQGYLSGDLASPKTDDRLSFHLYDSPAVAIASLESLLASRSTASVLPSQTTISSPVSLPSGLPSTRLPFVTSPESSTPHDDPVQLDPQAIPTLPTPEDPTPLVEGPVSTIMPDIVLPFALPHLPTAESAGGGDPGSTGGAYVCGASPSLVPDPDSMPKGGTPEGPSLAQCGGGDGGGGGGGCTSNCGGGGGNQRPSASFTTSVSGFTLSVDASASSDSDGYITNYDWNWGDGTSPGTGQTASHVYSFPGTYIVGLTVRDDDGATASTSRTVTIEGPPQPNRPPEVTSPNGPPALPVNEPGSFQATASDADGDLVQITFHWGDGTTSQTGYNPPGPQTRTHTWTQPGHYAITTQAIDENGASSLTSAPFFVRVLSADPTQPIPGMPAPAFVPPKQPDPPTASQTRVLTGESVSFTAVTTDPLGDSIRYQFSWDDNTTSWSPWVQSGQSVTLSHSWTNAGAPRVQVQARNTQGNCQSSGGTLFTCVSPWSVRTTIQVKTPTGIAPTAPAFTLTQTTSAMRAITLQSSDSNGLSTYIRYRLEWGDGTQNQTDWTPRNTSTPPLTHAWDQPGSYTLTATATNDVGLTSTSSLVVTITDNPPQAPLRPSGWELVALNATTTYNATTTDPDADPLRYEYDWGDDSAPTQTTQVASGTQAGASHTWTKPGTHMARVRAIDQHGMRGPWSNATHVRVGTSATPYEITVTDLSVSNPTPNSADLTNPEDPLSVEPGESFLLRATVDNRGPDPVNVDVTFYDDDKPFYTKTELISAGGTITSESAQLAAGTFGTGVRELSVVVAQSISGALEVSKTNNDRFISIRVREPTTLPPAFGALYDGPGPKNAEGVQLTTGLYQHYRAQDANTFDEIPHGDASPMRLLVWSPQLGGVPNQTWYFVDDVYARVNAGTGLSLSDPMPTNASNDTILSEQFPLSIGYSERAGNGRTTVGMDYPIKNGSSLQASASMLEWRIRTNRTPIDPTHAVGFQFLLNTQAGSQSVWRELEVVTSVNYTRVERQGDGTLLLWHEIVRSGTTPTKASVETGTYSPASVPYASGDDYNVGDRSMTSLPVWDARVETRRTYYDGNTDKNAANESEPSGRSAAYHWFRLDGPIYRSLNVTWVFTPPPSAPVGQTFDASLHFPGPEEQGYEPGSQFAWAQFRAGITFTQDLSPEYRGMWTSRVLIDGKPTNLVTFHILSTTNDQPDGPHQTSDEELANRTAEAAQPVQKADPTNEDLDVLHSTNWKYLNESRVDQRVQGKANDTMSIVDTLLVDYIRSQADEALNIAEDETNGVCTDTNAADECKTVYTLGRELVDTATTTPTKILRQARADAFHTARRVIQPCSGLLKTDVPSLAQNPNVPDLSCIQQTAAALLNATNIVTSLADSTLDTVNSPLSNVSLVTSLASNLTGKALNTTPGTILDSAQPITSLVSNATSPIVQALPLSPSLANLNPKFVEDLTIAPVYDTIMQNCASQAQGVCQEGVATADSLFYNLYVANEDASKAWTYLNVPLGDLTLIRLDGAPADATNADLILTATLTPSQGSTATPPTNASQTAPTLRAQARTPAAANTPLLACAYYQLPGVSYVASTCIDTRNATLQALGAPTPSAGFPDTANVTLSAYSFNTNDPSVTASLRLESQTSHAALPVLASGAVFQVDLTQKTKPRVTNGDHADAALYSSNGQGASEWTLRRTLDASAGASSEWSWSTNDATALAGSYALGRSGRTLMASSNVTNPPPSLSFKSARNAADTTLDLTVQSAPPAVMGATTFALADDGEAVSLSANALPGALALHADDMGNLTLASQGGQASALRIVSANNRASCAAPATTNAISRIGADESGGACLVLASTSSLQSVSVSLATGGPSLSVTSQQASPAPLAILVQPPTAGSRSLDAYLSSTPQAVSVQSSLSSKTGTMLIDGAAPTDGSTTLAWSASDDLAQARVLARTGSTILYWNATNAPKSFQAATQWAADTISLRSAPTGGNVQYLLTNTGNAPQTPSGDHVAGTRTLDQVQTSASLTALDHVDASLAHESFTLRTAASPEGAFGVRYARDAGPKFSLDASRVPTDGFTLSTSEAEGGAHTTTYQAGAGLPAVDTVSWAGDFPTQNAHLEGSLTGAPSLVTITATPSSSSFTLGTNGESVKRASILHAPLGASVTTLDGEDTIHLGNPTSGVDVYRATLRDVETFSFTNQTGSLQITATPSPTHPLQVEVNRGANILSLTTGTTILPATLRATYSHTGFTTSATGITGSPTLDLQNKGPEGVRRLLVNGLPANLNASWASSPGLTTATFTHDAATGTIPSLLAESSLLSPGQSTPTDVVRLQVQNAPTTNLLTFDAAHDEMQYLGSAAAGLVSFTHANNLAGLAAPAQPQFATMTSPQADATGAQSLRLVSASAMTVRLGHAAGQPNRISLTGTSASNFFTTYTDPATRASIAANISNLPGSVTFDYTLGTEGANDTNAGGLALRHTSGGSVQRIDLTATSAGTDNAPPLRLDVRASNVPSSWTATWAPNRPLDLRASDQVFLPMLALRPDGEDAPKIVTATQDYVTIDGSDAAHPRLGIALPTGVSAIHAEAAGGIVTAAGLTSGRTLDVLDHEGAGSQQAILSFHADGVPHTFNLTTPPTGATTQLAWTASAATSALNYALDGITARWRLNATGVPTSLTTTLDAANGVLTASASGGVDAVDLRYVNNPTGTFRSEGPGVTLLDRATGVEEYDASAESFAINLTRLTSLVVVLPMTDAAQMFAVGLTRAPLAPATDLAFTMAGGENAYQATANGTARSLVFTSQSAQASGGFRNTMVTDQSLTVFGLITRSKEGTSRLDLTRVPTSVDLTVAVDSSQNLALAYTANAVAESAAWVVNSSNVLTTATMTTAPRTLNVQAPTACSAETTLAGRVWSPTGDAAGTLDLTVALASAVQVLDASEPTRLLASCAGNEASVQLVGTGVQAGYWSLDPVAGKLAASIDRPGAGAQDARLILAGAGELVGLDAGASQLAGSLNVTGTGTRDDTGIEWTTTSTASTAAVLLKTTESTLNTTLSSPALSWTLRALPSVPNVLHLGASGPSASLDAVLRMPNMSATLGAQGLPSIIDWNLPLHACPNGGQALDASVSTRGSGSVGWLSSWIIPAQASSVTTMATTEQGVLECVGNDMQLDVSFTGLQSVTWVQAIGGVSVQSAASTTSFVDIQNPLDLAADFGASLLRFVGFQHDASAGAPALPVPTPRSTTSGSTATLTSTTLQRDPGTPAPSQAGLLLDTGSQGATMGTIITNPSASMAIGVSHAPGAASAQATYTAATAGSVVDLTFRDATSALTTILKNAPTVADLPFLADGTIEYIGDGPVDEVHGTFHSDGGTHIQAALTGGVPAHVTIMPGASACAGSASVPYRFSMDAHGGTIGFVDYWLTDTGENDGPKQPRLVVPGGVGLALDCGSGNAREIRGLLPKVSTLSIQTDPCAIVATLPTTSAATLTYPIVTPFFTANLTHKATVPAGLLTVSVMTLDGKNGDINFEARDASTGGIVPMTILQADYYKGLASTNAACSMLFGQNVIQDAHVTLNSAPGNVTVRFGVDPAGRSLFRVGGGQVGSVLADIHLMPPDAKSGPSVDVPKGSASAQAIRVNVSASVPVDTMNVRFHQQPKALPVPPEVTSPDYLYATLDRNNLVGGEVNILGFNSVSIVGDLDPATKAASVRASYDGANNPLDVFLKGTEGGIGPLRLTATSVPSALSFAYSQDTGATLSATLASPIQNIHGVLKTVGAACGKDPKERTIVGDVTGIPAGVVNIELGGKTCKAGNIGVHSSGGPIAGIEIGQTFGSDVQDYALISIQNVGGLSIQYDLDGDVNHGKGNPYYVFVSTDGLEVPIITLRLHFDDWGFGIGAAGIAFGDTQLRWYFQDFAFIPIPHASVAGIICAAAVPVAEIGYKTRWFTFPVSVSDPKAICV